MSKGKEGGGGKKDDLTPFPSYLPREREKKGKAGSHIPTHVIGKIRKLFFHLLLWEEKRGEKDAFFLGRMVSGEGGENIALEGRRGENEPSLSYQRE